MGCFLGCFGSSKDKNRRKRSPRRHRNGGPSPQKSTVSSVLSIPEKATELVPELSEKSEEQLSLSTRKKVTFDSNVKTYEHVTVYESTDSLLENNNNNSEREREREKEENLAKSKQSHTNSEDDSITSSVGSYPLNHRYQNCRDNDDEAIELEYADSDLDDCDDYDDDEESMLCQEVWSETIPTASMESRTEISLARVDSQEVDSPVISSKLLEQEGKTTGLNRNARDRSVYVYPVLNPVENLNQWKAVKSKGTTTPPLKPQQKENLATHEEEPSFKYSSFNFKPQSQKDLTVDASLSNWLVSSETSPRKNTSSIELGTVTSEKSMSQGSTTSYMSIEDRPILGALTLEEIKQFSASSSPRKSPSRSPDDMPIIGSVGTYWKQTDEEAGDSGSVSSYKGIPNTTSKYREDKKVNWHSTPFETRLERALNQGAAEAS